MVSEAKVIVRIASAERVLFRYVTANLTSQMELALNDLGRSKMVLDFDILHGLLDQVARSTRVSNPEISQEAKALSNVFGFAHKFTKDKVLEAVSGTRELLETAVF